MIENTKNPSPEDLIVYRDPKNGQFYLAKVDQVFPYFYGNHTVYQCCSVTHGLTTPTFTEQIVAIEADQIVTYPVGGIFIPTN